MTHPASASIMQRFALAALVLSLGLFLALFGAASAFAQDDDDDDGGARNPAIDAVAAQGFYMPAAKTLSGCTTTEITFDENGLSAGNIVSNQLTGVSVSSDPSNRAMIFDSNCSGSGCSGQDPDLGVNQGNILIVSEDGDASDPDDRAAGGTLSFVFNNEVRVKSVQMIDMDDGSNSAILRAWDNTSGSGSALASQGVGAAGDGSVQDVSFDVNQVRRLDVILASSGAVGRITLCGVIDLELYMLSNAPSFSPMPAQGDQITYTIGVFNNLNDGDPFQTFFSGSAGSPRANMLTATNFTVTVPFDNPLLGFVSASCGTGCSVTQNPAVGGTGTIEFTINSLAPGTAVPGDAFQLQFVGEVLDDGVVQQRAEVASDQQDDVDSTPGNCGSTGPWSPPVGSPEDDCFRLSFGVLPVELVAFDAQTDGRRAVLSWKTAAELNNAGFEIQHRSASAPNAEFETIGWADGHGTTNEPQRYEFRVEDLDPGQHVFRLRQLDYDGAFEYSPLLEVSVEMPDSYVLSEVYPNPFNPQASFSFGVHRAQLVQIDLYNVLGQHVQSIYRGRPSAGTTQVFSIDGSGLQSGTYLLRVVGEQFVDSQTITLVK